MLIDLKYLAPEYHKKVIVAAFCYLYLIYTVH